jgi:hypothetical protein
VSEAKKKPTGHLWVAYSDMREDGGWGMVQVEFPDEKAAIERFILQLTLDSLRSGGLDIYQLAGEPIQNPEDDFDFTLPTASGDEYLDLMEVALLGGMKITGSSYRGAHASYNYGERADAIFGKIMEKAKKYGLRTLTPIHLLLYATDYRFEVRGSVEELLAYRSAKEGHPFKSILNCTPKVEGGAVVSVIYPRSLSSFHGFDEARHRSGSCGLVRSVKYSEDEEWHDL